MNTTAAEDVQRNVRIYLDANACVSDVRALALGLAEFVESQYAEADAEKDYEKEA